MRRSRGGVGVLWSVRVVGVVLALGGCGASESGEGQSLPEVGGRAVPESGGDGDGGDPRADGAGVSEAGVEGMSAVWDVTVSDEDPLRVKYTAGPGLVPPVSADRLREDWTNRQRETVIVSRDAIGLRGKEVLRLADGQVPEGARDGHEVPRLRAALDEVVPYSADVVFLLDHRLRFADLVDVLFTASRAGGIRWLIAVRDPGDPPGTTSGALELHTGQRSIGVLPDDEGPSPEQINMKYRELALVLRIAEESVELGELLRTGEFRVLGRVAPEDGWEPVRRIAREAAGRDDPESSGVVVFGADRGVTLARVVDALAAVNGPGSCGSWGWPPLNRAECWFSWRVLVGGERSLRGLAQGRGAVTIEEGEQRSRHADTACTGSVRGGRMIVRLGTEVGEMDTLYGEWLWARVDAAGQAEVRLTPPWRETWKERGEAIVLTRESKCAKLEVEIGRHPDKQAQHDPLRGRVEFDCAVGDVKVRGRLSFTGCTTWGE